MELAKVREFQDRVYEFYRTHRRDLPWRRTNNPYQILVSELMLQQTQVGRVLTRFSPFVSKFPNFHSLDAAPLEDVLKEWQGLGYNRRALALKAIARKVIKDHGGILPCEEETLLSFPGIGKATSASIRAFAFNLPAVVIETNIRRVYIHCFFPDAVSVADREIRPLIEESCDLENPRDWYYALMDFGWHLGRMGENPNRKSAQYRIQPAFTGSDRQIRGKIIRQILLEGGMAREELISRLVRDHNVTREKISRILRNLEDEGFIHQAGGELLIRNG